jgi:D-alanyl-D-alanine carboxypeptidase (penicillin-binding protein 5/6)
MKRFASILSLVLAFAVGTPVSSAAEKKTTKPATTKTATTPAKKTTTPAKTTTAKTTTATKTTTAVGFPLDPVFDGVPQISAGSAIVVDAVTGQVLTALIVAEEGDLDKMVKVQASDTWVEPSMLYIKPGNLYSRRDFLNILLVHSMNDVARALARDNAGSVEDFADKMNAKAASLGMRNSHFVNPNGLPAADQYSSARDMAKVAMVAYRNRVIREMVCQKFMVWHYNDGRTKVFDTTNKVLKSYPFCNGMKTGYTEAAGRCLISSATRNGKHIIVVIMGDNSNITVDSYRLLAWGLANAG